MVNKSNSFVYISNFSISISRFVEKTRNKKLQIKTDIDTKKVIIENVTCCTEIDREVTETTAAPVIEQETSAGKS